MRIENKINEKRLLSDPISGIRKSFPLSLHPGRAKLRCMLYPRAALKPLTQWFQTLWVRGSTYDVFRVPFFVVTWSKDQWLGTTRLTQGWPRWGLKKICSAKTFCSTTLKMSLLITFSSKSIINIIPLQAKQYTPYTPYMVSKNLSVCLAVYLFVVNFDPNYIVCTANLGLFGKK